MSNIIYLQTSIPQFTNLFCWILFFFASSYRFDANGNLETLKRYAWDGSQSKLMDDFVYEYNESINNGHNNRLSGLRDFAGQSQFSHVDIDESMSTDNYEYDEIGQLISDADEEIENISWTVTNKVKEIQYENGDFISFDYDAMGNRIAKHVTKSGHTVSTYYFLDAQGNQMALYKHITEDPLGGGENNLYLSERNIYGSNRIGQEKIGEILASSNPNEVNINTATQNSIGDKFFEMSNHLGNVLEVVTDRKLPVPDGNGNIDYFLADVVSYSDYYPFGMQMPGRNGSTGEYRYGFNGKEMDNEVSGNGNSYDYGFRIYNPRLGKFLSVDPLTATFPFYTPYQFAGNKPIAAIDLDGLEEKIVIYNYDKYGEVQSIEKTTYNNVEDYGPLGNGVYTVHKRADGTFSENYTSGEGNSINSFQAEGISQNKFITEGGKHMGVEKRLNARLIEGVVENALIDAGNGASQVREDVQVLENAPDNFIGKFATFKEGTADKYVGDFESATPSEPHKSNEAKTSGEIGNSDVLIKYYDGAASSTDNVPNQIGLVREGIYDHGVEAVRSVADPNVNIGAENATRVKNDAEKKQ